MALAQSKVTAQGQISVPAEVRQKLGIGPGSVLEWDEEGDSVVVRTPAGIPRKTFIGRSLGGGRRLRRRWKSSMKACGVICRKNMRDADTNVLVRLIARDDRKQVAAAESFVSKGAWASTLGLMKAT
jgi:AbrB family looped-hinge helix DNA binding protein